MAVSSAVDAIIDEDGELYPTMVHKAKKKPQASQIGKKLESIASIFTPREPKRVKIVGELALGAHSMDFPKIRGMHRITDDSAMGFMSMGRFGVEISTARQPLSFYAAPFIELVWQGLFDVEEFATEQDDDNDDGKVSAILFGSGVQAGVQYKLWRFYGVVDYMANFSRISRNVSVPLQNVLGVGVGVGCELAFMRVGVQYMYQSYAYNTGTIYEYRNSSILVLDSMKVRSGAHAVFVTLGVGF